MRLSWVVVLAACGRVGFDPGVNADAARDAETDSVSDVGLPADLVSWVPLDDASLLDVVNGAHGMCGTSCPTPVSGHAGMAMHFDGSTMCAWFADSGQYDQPSITISIWANEDNPLGQRECTSWHVVIGCDDNNGYGEHYQGALDELRIYKRALSQAEVQTLP